MANRIDLKQLVLLINDQKNLDTNLCLDEGCVIFADDQSPLIKVINYFLNYLQNISSRTLEISLDLMANSMLMTMMAFTDKEALPELSNNLKDALAGYNADYEAVHDAGNYFQIKITFPK